MMKIGILFTWATHRLAGYVALLSEEVGISLEPVMDSRKRSYVRLTQEFADPEEAREYAARVRSKLGAPRDRVEWPFFVWVGDSTEPLSFDEFLLRELRKAKEAGYAALQPATLPERDFIDCLDHGSRDPMAGEHARLSYD